MDVMKLAILAAWAMSLGEPGSSAYAAGTPPTQTRSAGVRIEARLTVLPACDVTTSALVRETTSVRTTCSPGLVPGVGAIGARPMETMRLSSGENGGQRTLTPVSVERTRSGADGRTVLITVDF